MKNYCCLLALLAVASCGISRKSASLTREAATLSIVETGSKAVESIKESDAKQQITTETGEWVVAFSHGEPSHVAPEVHIVISDSSITVKGSVPSLVRHTVLRVEDKKEAIEAETQGTREESVRSVRQDSETERQESVEPVKDPYRWRYILWILLILAAAVVAAGCWLRKTKALRSIVPFIRRLFG